METIQDETIKIYRCEIHFSYTGNYIEVILLATNETEAKNKCISKCLENYGEIINTIDFKTFYDENENKELPLNFPRDSTTEFEKYLNDELFGEFGDRKIECLNDCSFDIINKYD